jgi:hypothetical protein
MSSKNITVKEAARLLDNHNPGWYREISIKDLDLTHCRKCILGQSSKEKFDMHHPLYKKLSDYEVFWNGQYHNDWVREIESRRDSESPKVEYILEHGDITYTILDHKRALDAFDTLVHFGTRPELYEVTTSKKKIK